MEGCLTAEGGKGRCSTAAAQMARRRGYAGGGGEMQGIYRRGVAPG
jgi:hypothetical protein